MQNTMRTWPRLGSNNGQLGVSQVHLQSLMDFYVSRMSQLIRWFLLREVCVWLAGLVLSKHTKDMQNTIGTWTRLGSKNSQLGVGQEQL